MRTSRAHRTIVTVALVFAATVQAGCRNRTAPSLMTIRESPELYPRAGEWASPVTVKGLPNLHVVTKNLYRGAQPTDEGLQQLTAMGVKTVVNLRGGDDDTAVLNETSLEYRHIPMSALDIRDADVVEFLRIACDQRRAPVFVHCQQGADRTGVVCAMYRVVVQGWPKEDAIAEMTRGGMGFNSMLGGLASYVREADVERFKRESGIE